VNEQTAKDIQSAVASVMNNLANQISQALDILHQSGIQIIPNQEIKPMFNFDAKITELAALRERLEKLSQTRSAFITQMKAQPDYQDNEYELGETERMVSEITGEIKNAAVDQYRETGNKQLHLAVKIKDQHKFIITDQETALEFCKKNLPIFIVLDQQAFLDYAKVTSGKGNTVFAPIQDFVNRIVIPTATISQDLSDYLVSEPAVIEPVLLERRLVENPTMDDIPF
jgi:hypothetical protein